MSPPSRPALTGRARTIVVLLLVALLLETIAIIGLGVAVAERSNPSVGDGAGPAGAATLPGVTLPTPLPPLSATTGTVETSSGFSNNDQWQTGSVSAHARARIAGGKYLFTGWGDYQHISLGSTADYQALSASTTVSMLPDAADAGVGCQSTKGEDIDQFQLTIRADHFWYLESRLLTLSQPPTMIATASFVPKSGPTSIELACVVEQDAGTNVETLRVAAFVNGALVADRAVRAGQTNPSGWQPYLEMGTFGTRSTVAFSHFTLRILQSGAR